MNRILVTGASGYIGTALTQYLYNKREFKIIGAYHKQRPVFSEEVGTFQIAGLSGDTDWSKALNEVDVVVHLAARVHVMNDTARDPLAIFRQINVAGTLNLARQAAGAGVKRFIYLSSIKVNGECTQPAHPFNENDLPAPQDPYAISKFEAEEGLRLLAGQTGMAVTIIRPPLVYGPGVKANFRKMLLWVKKGYPLPLGAIHNSRSFIALDNLVDFIYTCIINSRAADRLYLAADGEDVSTTELLHHLAQAMNRPARLIPVPVSILVAGAAVLGRRDMAQRLCSSLQVDIAKARKELAWNPPVRLSEGLQGTVKDFLDETSF